MSTNLTPHEPPHVCGVLRLNTLSIAPLALLLASSSSLVLASPEAGASGAAEPLEAPQDDPISEAVQPAAEPGDDGAAENAEYDSLVLSALDAFQAGDWPDARARFEQAHGIRPTARTLRTIGMCAFNQGDMSGALRNLEAALADDRKALTAKQKLHVEDLIRQAENQVARVRLVVTPPGASVRVDGKAPSTIAGGEIVLEPGLHEVLVQAEGHVSSTRYVRVAARDRSTIEIRLQAGEGVQVDAREQAQPAAGKAAQTGPAQPAYAPAAATRVRTGATESAPMRNNTWAWVAFGVGAAGVLAAGVSTALALSDRDSLEPLCPDDQCGPAQHGRVDDYHLLRSVALASIAVGAVGAGVGTFWLISGGSESDDGPRVEAVLTPGWAGFRGQL